MSIIVNFLSEFRDKIDRIVINLILLHGEKIVSINLDKNISLTDLSTTLTRQIISFNNSYSDNEATYLNSLRFFILKQKKIRWM